MRFLYEIDDVGTVEIERAYRDRTYNVSTVWVEEDKRCQGYGTDLMNRVCRDADEDGVELWLVPMTTPGMTEDSLRRFYERFGFKEKGPYFIPPTRDHTVATYVAALSATAGGGFRQSGRHRARTSARAA